MSDQRHQLRQARLSVTEISLGHSYFRSNENNQHPPQALPPFKTLTLPCSSAKESALSNEDYIKRHHIDVYMKDVISTFLEQGKKECLSAKFLAGYFLEICAGRHGRGRPYSFASGTPTNRHHTLQNARASFAEMCRNKKEVKLMDCLSLMMLMSPDFPLNVVRSAFKPAAFISRGIIQIDNHDTKIPLETFLDCLSITFIYERFLVEMRHDAFDSKSKQFIPLPRVEDSMTSVCELVEAAGWSVPPPEVMHRMVVDAADSKKCISFDILVRSMCESSALKESVQAAAQIATVSSTDAALFAKGIETFRGQMLIE